MNQLLIKVCSNWSQIGGCSFSQCVQEFPADPDVFTKPDVNALVDENKSILLSREQSSDYCEIYVNKFPHYKIQSVSFVCNVVKVEFFQGPIMEYMETIYGEIVDQADDQFESYRYDVEIKKSGVTDLTLRFLTNSSEVCIFGFILYTSPNPNGITSLLPPRRCLNAQNALQAEVNPSTVSEKLFEFGVNAIQHNALTFDQHFKEKCNIANNDEPAITNIRKSDDMLEHLKIHIDKRFEEIAMLFNIKLTEMEQRQNKKFDKLLNILENKQF